MTLNIWHMWRSWLVTCLLVIRYVKLWPWPLIPWPWTFVVYRLSHVKRCVKSSNIEQCDLKIENLGQSGLIGSEFSQLRGFHRLVMHHFDTTGQCTAQFLMTEHILLARFHWECCKSRFSELGSDLVYQIRGVNRSMTGAAHFIFQIRCFVSQPKSFKFDWVENLGQISHPCKN